ncbi:Cytosine/adenosine deaminase [Sinosporangium album]|uniref:Cytosine/adenosine deaminase n=1 Tax=Sinosporangium album TaxID=504805 RepID=A0A1G7YPS2_9ACTN|nr:amidohydrolase family protein [Sinosporangium album]SDG98538.1 Cytosine/adenosine deaminase [Sinosporangium album]
MTTTRTLLRGGHIVSMDPAMGDLVGDVLIEDGTITAIGPHLDIAEGAADIVDASRHIVIPGFIDSHRHLFQALMRGLAADWSLFQYFTTMFGMLGPRMSPEHMSLGTTLGAYDALDSGVTAVFDYSHNQSTPEHTDEAVRALQSTGIRAIFGYGGTMAEQLEILSPPFKSTTPSNEAEIRRVRGRYFASDSGLVTMGLAVRGPDSSPMDIVRADFRLARELGLRINTHIGMAVLDPYGRPNVTRLHSEGLLGDDLIFGHCNLLTDEEFRMMADAGVSASVTPEDESAMGHGWPPITQLLNAGIRPNIGIDTCMAVGGDPFTAMRFALAVPRGLANQRALESSVNPWLLDLSARDVLEFATIEGARALGMERATGSLTPGKQADIVMIRTDHISMAPVLDPVASIVHHASRQTVDTVFVAGKAVKRDGELVGVNAAELSRRAGESAAKLLDAAGVSPGWAPPPPAPPEGAH